MDFQEVGPPLPLSLVPVSLLIFSSSLCLSQVLFSWVLHFRHGAFQSFASLRALVFFFSLCIRKNQWFLSGNSESSLSFSHSSFFLRFFSSLPTDCSESNWRRIPWTWTTVSHAIRFGGEFSSSSIFHWEVCVRIQAGYSFVEKLHGCSVLRWDWHWVSSSEIYCGFWYRKFESLGAIFQVPLSVSCYALEVCLCWKFENGNKVWMILFGFNFRPVGSTC